MSATRIRCCLHPCRCSPSLGRQKCLSCLLRHHCLANDDTFSTIPQKLQNRWREAREQKFLAFGAVLMSALQAAAPSLASSSAVLSWLSTITKRLFVYRGLKSHERSKRLVHGSERRCLTTRLVEPVFSFVHFFCYDPFIQNKVQNLGFSF